VARQPVVSLAPRSDIRELVPRSVAPWDSAPARSSAINSKGKSMITTGEDKASGRQIRDL
jgi:hypothetical protein